MKQSTKDAIDRYIVDRIPPGSFLKAVLSNDLLESFARADEENKEDLAEIVAYLYNQIPSDAWGSPEKVRDWLSKREVSEDE